jgi:hypothetical protein
MSKLVKFLDGKKTILGFVAGGVVLILSALEVLDAQTTAILEGIIVTWTGVSLRAAIAKSKTNPPPTVGLN